MPRKNLNDFEQYTHIYVDAMNLVARSYHGMSDLSFKGKKTGMLYGVVRFFITYKREHPRAEITFLWEGKNSWRQKKYPFYKASRKRKKYTDDGEFMQCLDRVKKILPSMGIRQESCETMEADDLAAHHCLLPEVAGHKVLLVSKDEDWYVNSRSNVDILWGNALKTREIICEELGFSGCRMPAYKALTGCPSDEFKGIPFFPRSLAKELLNHTGDIRVFEELLIMMDQRKWAEKVKMHMWILERNYEIASPAHIDKGNIEVIVGDYCKESLVKSLNSAGMTKMVERLG